MRRGIATVVILGLVGLGAAACGSDGDTAGAPPSAVAGSAAPGDPAVITTAACNAAIVDSEARQRELADSLNEMRKLDTEDADEVAPIEKEVDDTMMRWSYRLTLLAGQDIDSDVKVVLTDAAGTISKLNEKDGEAALAGSMATLEDIPTKLKNVCL